MPTTPSERRFVIFRRGQVRDDVILAHFRNALATMTNPDTGAAFTVDEINQATQAGSRFYIEADAVDVATQAMQARALWFVDQIRPKRSNTEMLEQFHGPLWLGENSRLPATGGSGPILAPATNGSSFPGSTTIGDPSAATATDVNGIVYQNLYTTVASGGSAALTLQAVDTGANTNPIAGTVLTWSSNQPLGADPECSVTSNFSGGFGVEIDSEYADRIEERMRYRAAAGNPAHCVAWARQASTAIETAFVYPCAFHAGSLLIAITQKRATNAATPEGPTIRTEPSAGTLVSATEFLVPPDSPVFPERAYVVVVAPDAQPSDLVLRLNMTKGANGGWYNFTPWPNPDSDSSYPAIDVVTTPSSTSFTVTTDKDLPGGATSISGEDAPQLMAWFEEYSRFERLYVSEVSKSGTTATVTLTSAPTTRALAVGDRISPYTDRLTVIAHSLESYFDGLGPGEVIASTDPRFARAVRFPPATDAYPYRAGQALISVLIDTLGGTANDAELEEISRNDPDLPTEIIDGPKQVTLGAVNVYPFAEE